MNKLVIAFAATMAIMSFGCKKKTGGGSGEAMAKMAEFKDKMCACKDAECAKKVNEELTAWSKANAPKDGKAVAMSDADTKKSLEIGTAMSECMGKATGGGMAGGSGDMAGSGSAAGSGDAAGSGSAAAAGSGSAAAGSGDAAGSGSAAAAGSGSAAAGSGDKKEEKKEEKK